MILTGLADRVFCDAIRYVEEDQLEHFRQWGPGTGNGDTFLPWARVGSLAKSKGIRSHGHFDGKPAMRYAAAMRKALLVLTAFGLSDGAVLVCDSDGDAERIGGMLQAMAAGEWPFAVVCGVAVTMRECWVLAGFEPTCPEEGEVLEQTRRALGFNPCTEPHRLTARGAEDKKSAKRVLAVLTGGDRDRERDCWAKACLSLLAQRGREAGLAGYLAEVRAVLVPVLTETG